MRTTLVIARCSTECGFHFDWELGQRVIEPKDGGLFRRRAILDIRSGFSGKLSLRPGQIVEGFNRAPQRPTEVNRRLVDAVIGDTIDAKAIDGDTARSQVESALAIYPDYGQPNDLRPPMAVSLMVAGPVGCLNLCMLPFVTKKCSMTLLGCVSIRNVP